MSGLSMPCNHGCAGSDNELWRCVCTSHSWARMCKCGDSGCRVTNVHGTCKNLCVVREIEEGVPARHKSITRKKQTRQHTGTVAAAGVSIGTPAAKEPPALTFHFMPAADTVVCVNVLIENASRCITRKENTQQTLLRAVAVVGHLCLALVRHCF